MAPPQNVNPEADIDYLVLLISQSEFKPNFHATAAAADFSSANNAQKKYKKIVEQSGKYKLVKGKIVAVEPGEGREEEG